MTADAVEIVRLAEKLTAEQSQALCALRPEWQPGPYLDDDIVRHLEALRQDGLIERQFGDLGKPDTQAAADGFSIEVHACWWFRPTSLGAALRARAAQHDHEVG